MGTKENLLALLERRKGEYLSGEEIARLLSVSRTAVWKAVNALRSAGYEINAVQNRGYCLDAHTDILSIHGIRQYLNRRWEGLDLELLPCASSTNALLRERAVSGAPEGSVILTNQQTNGRGRLGREFYSPTDAGLYMSVILKPQGTIHDSLLITTAAAVAVYRAVAQICGIQLDIKWVNDLFYKGKKVCGILTEAVTDFEGGNIEFVVVGIGLNLYLDQEKLPQKLRSIAGALYETKEDAERTDRNQLTAMIVNELRKETADLKLSPDYVTHNMIPGHQITITDGTSSRQAFALEICRDGRLKVREEDGQETILSFGEVSVTI